MIRPYREVPPSDWPELRDITSERESIAYLFHSAELLRRNGEAQLAFHLWRQILYLDPWHESTLRHLMIVAKMMNNLEAARKYARVLEKLNLSVSTSIEVADVYYDSEENEDAIKAYFRIVQLDVVDEEQLHAIYRRIGNIYMRWSDSEGAREYFDKAHALKPKCDDMLVNYGVLDLQSDDLEKAYLRFSEAIFLNSNNAKAYVGLGMVHYLLGDQELAVANLGKALDFDRYNKPALLFLTEWAAPGPVLELAIDRLSDLICRHPTDLELGLRICRAYLRLQRWNLFHIELIRLNCLSPHDRDVEELNEECEELKRRGVYERDHVRH